MDVHNLAAFHNAFRCRTENLEARALFVEHYCELARRQPIVVIAPDFGAAKRTEKFRRDLSDCSGTTIGIGIMEKYRAGGAVSGSTLVGDIRGKTAIVIDDLISSGGTLRRAALACRNAGATAVHAAATHGLFTSGAAELLIDPAFNSIAVTDTVASRTVDLSTHANHVQVVDSTKLVAAAISRWHGDTT
jgi:ribose-phosphate pyrophosphokinase